MAKRVSISKQVHQPLEIDLWADGDGAVFETQPQTKARAEQLDPLRERLVKVAEMSADEQLDLIGDYLDIALKPTNGGRKKPSTLIKAKWNAGEVDADQVANVFEAVLTGTVPSS
jgi:hypothetical protein